MPTKKFLNFKRTYGKHFAEFVDNSADHVLNKADYHANRCDLHGPDIVQEYAEYELLTKLLKLTPL